MGQAAAQVVASNISFADVDVPKLLKDLRCSGVRI